MRIFLTSSERFCRGTHVSRRGRWDGAESKNGDLLRRAAADRFDAFISTDKGLEYEQNRATLPLSVVVILGKDNKLATLESLVPALLRELDRLKPSSFVKIDANG